MKRSAAILASLIFTTSVFADDVSDSDRLLCSASEVTVCFELDECYSVSPDEIDVPHFVVIDLKKKEIATTKASNENRKTSVNTVVREGDRFVLQGIENGRAFNFVIDKETGLLTVAVARDGMTVSVFGACTDSDT